MGDLQLDGEVVEDASGDGNVSPAEGNDGIEVNHTENGQRRGYESMGTYMSLMRGNPWPGKLVWSFVAARAPWSAPYGDDPTSPWIVKGICPLVDRYCVRRSWAMGESAGAGS